jgi:uncharacterized RDD family membrane protein YckC
MGRVGFWYRVLAAVIDGALFLPIGLALLILLRDSPYAAAVASSVAWLAYSSLEVAAAGTPGKLVLGLRIAYPDGSTADRWTLFLRWSTKQLPAILGLLYLLTTFVPVRLLANFAELLVLIGCLFASTDSKQAWHDRWAKTAVCRKPRKVVPLPPAFPVLPPR